MKYLLLALLAATPFYGLGNYPLHLVINCLLWGYVYTSWSIMGRLGLVSFGHGAFLGIGAYVVVMGWNHFGLTPWVGIPIALALQQAGVPVVVSAGNLGINPDTGEPGYGGITSPGNAPSAITVGALMARLRIDLVVDAHGKALGPDEILDTLNLKDDGEETP